MKHFALFIITSLLLATQATAQKACWKEWEYKDQWLLRAGSCAENVSIPDFERGFCKVRGQAEVLRTAAKCPTTVKTKEGADIVSQKVVARCMGLRPPAAGGTANTYYYGGKSFADSRDSLRDLCVGFDGKWSQDK